MKRMAAAIPGRFKSLLISQSKNKIGHISIYLGKWRKLCKIFVYPLYIMPKKIYRKKMRRGGRRLQPSSQLDYKLGQPVRNVGRAAVKGARGVIRYVDKKVTNRKPTTKRSAQKNFNIRLNSDNITHAPAFVIGKRKRDSFEERVSKIQHPPVVVHRKYAWTAECQSGRKAFFQIPINSLSTADNGGTLYIDAVTNYTQLTTNTAAEDPTLINTTSAQFQQKVYVDYLSEKLKMVNSGSNSIKGKITLYAYKRDAGYAYSSTSVPITPINIMMYASNTGFVRFQTGTEQTVGNGWNFDTVGATSGTNYTSNYNCPGSAMNVGAVCAFTDSELDILDSHISDFTGHFFSKVNECSFSLKPGQQIDHYTIMHDLPILQRQAVTLTHIKGIAYSLVVSFEAGLVGDSNVLTNNVVSTGSAQLSCIVEEKRILGTYGKQKMQMVMRTAPLTNIALADQYTINPDSGVADTGYEQSR